ncbi:TrlF family AAA-like ATPase [Candidatus Spongiihabitans sp.]|uniref:TrlF family AAA-like ATPase n=1 Tax=Candidatus Spongiihabitans sp. TaxID=3101308 RepID=UPI003C7ACAAA
MTTKNNFEYLGAKFYKCALQVNPWAYSQRHHKANQECSGEEEYNTDILNQCQKNKIKVVGLADHNDVNSSAELRKLLENNDITVFPGFEIESSEGIHMVCLYHEKTQLNDLQHYLRELLSNNSEKLQSNHNIASSMSCHDIASKVLNKQKGFWYAAHMTGKNGILRLARGGNNHKELWQNSLLLIAGQIPGTVADMDIPQDGKNKTAEYKKIIENKNPDYKRDRAIVIINAKDVSVPSMLEEKSASVQIKMTTPGMESFLDAFYDPKSRVRLNYDMKESHHSKILSISWEGGSFFKETNLTFSENLNAVIGGHGAGKSTLLESIRYALNMPPKQNEVKKKYERLCDSNLHGAKVTIKIWSAAQLGNIFTISRRFGMSPEVVKDDTGEVTPFLPTDILPKIEIYSQSEILRIAEDEQAQYHLLDRFLPDQNDYHSKINELKKRLAENREKLMKITTKKDILESELNQLAALKEKIKVYKKIGIEEKLKKLEVLDKEKIITGGVDKQIQEVAEWVNNYDDIFDMNFISANTIKDLPNEGFIQSMSTALQKLQQTCDSSLLKIKENISLCREEVNESKVAIQKQHNMATDEVQSALAKLQSHAGRDGREISGEAKKLVTRISIIENKKPEVKSITTLVEKIKQERRNILKEYTDTAYDNTQKLKYAIEKINNGDLNGKVKINLVDAHEKSALKDFLMTIENIGKHAIKWVDHSKSVFPTELASIIKKKGKEGLLERYKAFGLTDNSAEKIATACHEGSEMLLKLEEVEITDKIDIQLNTAHDKEQPNYHSLEGLSTGQQCTAILNIILLENKDPLIMDQPEDNLDNSFIAERIVKDLRNCKDNRQFIFATHNANIPIFGDAELILVIESDTTKEKILKERIGSVDKPAVREAAARILDGGREAFYMRQHKYGFDHDD